MTPCDWTRYPGDWKATAAAAIAAAGDRCQGCGAEHGEDGTAGTTLTVHHPDRDPENPGARLTVLCARCHLSVEAHARRRQRVHESRVEGETMPDAWRRAQIGITADQMELT